MTPPDWIDVCQPILARPADIVKRVSRASGPSSASPVDPASASVPRAGFSGFVGAGAGFAVVAGPWLTRPARRRSCRGRAWRPARRRAGSSASGRRPVSATWAGSRSGSDGSWSSACCGLAQPRSCRAQASRLWSRLRRARLRHRDRLRRHDPLRHFGGDDGRAGVAIGVARRRRDLRGRPCRSRRLLHRLDALVPGTAGDCDRRESDRDLRRDPGRADAGSRARRGPGPDRGQARRGGGARRAFEQGQRERNRQDRERLEGAAVLDAARGHPGAARALVDMGDEAGCAPCGRAARPRSRESASSA